VLRLETLSRIHTTESVKWTTVGSALGEIAMLRAGASPEDLTILDDYEAYLLGLPTLPMAAE